jgi:hypothetical protein
MIRTFALALVFSAACWMTALAQHGPELPASILDLPAAEAPALDVSLAPADDGGWNIALARGGAPVSGEAEVRISVDGGEPAIAAGDSHRLPALGDGVHEIVVGLYAADGRAYANGGVLVGRRVIVLESGGSAALANPTVIDAPIVGGRPAGSDTARTQLGTPIEIRFTSDSDLELHLHGYDIEAAVSPAWPVSMLFDASIPGRFPVESHGGAGEAVILYLEVYP